MSEPTWTRPEDVRAQLQKLWDKGTLLASLVPTEAAPADLFPLRLALRSPSSAELGGQFEAVRHWLLALREQAHVRVEMREFRHRQLGLNSVPAELWVDSLAQALSLLGKQKAAARFQQLLLRVQASQPALLPWLARRPLRALELLEEPGDRWGGLLALVAWLQAHPRPGIYLRQIDLPGVHSKWIESQRGLLIELLDLALPPEAVQSQAAGVGEFARRYGFLDKPLRVRFRPLDPGLAQHLGGQDLTLDSPSFAALPQRCTPPVQRIFITENEINFLSFPPQSRSLVVFGGGYGFEMLAQAKWLQGCELYYWGDIDSHGFAILDQLRAMFPTVQSLLMDRATWLAHQALWVAEERPAQRLLPRLNPAEQALYAELSAQTQGDALRLEQERIGFAHWLAALQGLPPPRP